MIYTEVTPNPASLKFVISDRPLLEHGAADFESKEEAADAPLANKLFDFEYVKGVFISTHFVTVTKDDAYKWEELIPEIKAFLKEFMASGEKVMNNPPEPPQISEEEESDVVKKIKQLLDDNVRPAVAMDGGDVIFDSFNDGIVRLKLQGACSGCPSSTMTLKMGIEGLLKRMVPGVDSVEAVSQ